MRVIVLVLMLAAMPSVVRSQSALVGAQFDVVSIKPHPYDPATGGGMRTLPDGAIRMTSVPIFGLLANAAPEPVYEVTGYPRWVRTETYDIVAKPAPDSHPTSEQRQEMMRNMLIDRLKLAGHLEEVERTTFGLVIARSDGRLGPQLEKSSTDCASAPPDGAQPVLPGNGIRCGTKMGPGTIEATGTSLDRLVLSMRGFAGGPVTNRTGLDGLYDVTLRFAPTRPIGTASDNDLPEFVTALQEQLGLKLVPEKTKVKIYVIDHIERPTPD
jgi:uncharacterized protein (TIGR03435 family)